MAVKGVSVEYDERTGYVAVVEKARAYGYGATEDEAVNNAFITLGRTINHLAEGGPGDGVALDEFLRRVGMIPQAATP